MIIVWTLSYLGAFLLGAVSIYAYFLVEANNFEKMLAKMPPPDPTTRVADYQPQLISGQILNY